MDLDMALKITFSPNEGIIDVSLIKMGSIELGNCFNQPTCVEGGV